MAANLAVVISSCDLYSDCWKPLFHSIHQYWSDCPYSIYLISNHKDSGDESIRTIKVGEHLGWGSNTKKALAEIHEEYILYLQEDYFLGAPMSTDAVEKHVHFCSDNNVDYIRLEAPYRDNLPIHGNIDYCEDPVAAKYAFSLQPSIWKKDSLHQFCIEGWTGWDYERNICDYIQKNKINIRGSVVNSKRKADIGFPMVDGTGIRKGIWTREGYRYLIENGFNVEAAGRKVEGKFMSCCMKQHGFYKIPARVIIRIMQKFMSR